MLMPVDYDRGHTVVSIHGSTSHCGVVGAFSLLGGLKVVSPSGKDAPGDLGLFRKKIPTTQSKGLPHLGIFPHVSADL